MLAHQAGLFSLDVPVDRALVADLDRLAVVLARQTPAWEPGTRQGYHGITLGFYESELLRRVDPRQRNLGSFFHDEIAMPLGLDVYIRLPESIPNSRLATLARPGLWEMLRGFGPRFMLEAMNPHSNIARALQGSELPIDPEPIYARNLEVPSGGAVGTARAIAHAYSVFATGGQELGLRRETLDLLAAPATPPTYGFLDVCLRADAVLARLHEAECGVAVRQQRRIVRVAWCRWLTGFRRPSDGPRLRLRDEQDGDDADRRPAGCGAERRAVRGYRRLITAHTTAVGRSRRRTGIPT